MSAIVNAGLRPPPNRKVYLADVCGVHRLGAEVTSLREAGLAELAPCTGTSAQSARP